MRRSRRCVARSLADDEPAVSTVLGAVLMFGLLVLTLVMIQVRFVPVWDHDREADHMRAVHNQFAILASDVGRQADNRTNAPLTDGVTLAAPQGFRFFAGSSLPGTLSFAPAPPGGGFTVAAPQVHIMSIGGRSLFAGSETWSNVVSAGTLSNLLTVENLRLRVLDVDANPVQYDGMSTTLTVRDAGGAVTGALHVTWLKGSSGFTLQFQTWIGDPAAPGNQPVSVQQDVYDQQTLPPSTCPVTGHVPPLDPTPVEVPCIYTDLMRQDLQFDQVILLTTAPFSLTLASTGLVADYTMARTVSNPGGGSTTVGQTGKLVAPYTPQPLLSGALAMTMVNNQFPSQRFVLEHGAVILEQDDGVAMAIPPPFSASVVAGQTNIRWVVPAMTGDSSTLAGPSQASVTLTPLRGDANFVATAPQVTFTLSTLYPGVWVQYWTTTLQLAGLVNTGAQPQFSTASTATTATVTIFGLVANPANTTSEDIQLSLKAATIDTAIDASGAT